MPNQYSSYKVTIDPDILLKKRIIKSLLNHPGDISCSSSILLLIHVFIESPRWSDEFYIIHWLACENRIESELCGYSASVQSLLAAGTTAAQASSEHTAAHGPLQPFSLDRKGLRQLCEYHFMGLASTLYISKQNFSVN